MIRQRLVRGVPGILGLLGLLLGVDVLAAGACWFLLAALIPVRTWVRRFLYAVVSAFAAGAALLTVLSVLHVRCDPRVVAALALLLLTGALLARPPAARVSLADADDLFALALGAVTALILLLPLIHSTPGEAIALISQTTDGGNHTQMVLGVQRAGGYVTLHKVTGMRDGMGTYPGAWAGNAWMLGRLLLSRSLHPIDAVRLLGYLGDLWYAGLTATSARVALELHRHLVQPTWWSRTITLLATAASTTLGFSLFILNLNSYTQIVALLAVLTACLLLTEQVTARAALVLAALCTVAVGQTWYLLLPLVGAAVLVLLSREQLPRAHLAAAAVCVLPFLLYPVVTGPGAHQVRFPGSELLPTLMGIVGLLVAIGVGLVVLLRGRSGDDALSLGTASVVVAALLLVVALVVVQSHKDPGASYYTAKALLALFLVGTTAAAACVGAVGSKRPLALLAILGLLAGTWSTRRDALPPRSAQTVGYLHPDELNALLAHHPDSLAVGTDVWVADGCNRVLDLVATKWLYDLYLTWTPDRPDSLGAYVDDPKKGLDAIAARTHLTYVTSVEVYVRHTCQENQLDQLAKLPKVKVFHVA